MSIYAIFGSLYVAFGLNDLVVVDLRSYVFHLNRGRHFVSQRQPRVAASYLLLRVSFDGDENCLAGRVLACLGPQLLDLENRGARVDGRDT